LLTDLCHEQFDFAWWRPQPQFADTDNQDVTDILEQSVSAVSAVDSRCYNRDTLLAAVSAVWQTGRHSYGRCMNILRKAVCGAKVCAALDSLG